MMYSGALLPYRDDEPPRMRIVRLPWTERPTTTPVEREARNLSIGSLGACCTSREVATGFAGDPSADASSVFGGTCAHAPIATSRARDARVRREATTREREAGLARRIGSPRCVEWGRDEH